MKWLGIAVLILAVLATLPVWRIAGGRTGYTAWELYSRTKECRHIPVEEAKARAKAAYLSVSAGVGGV